MSEDASTFLDRAKADIRQRAATGDLLPVTQYARANPELSRPPHLLELILADAAVRLSAGSLPTPAAYAAMFPEHAHDVIEVFASDSTVGRTETPSDESYSFLRPPTVMGDLGCLGKYRIVRKLAQGGMGIVFEGFHTNSDRAVAVKVIRPPYADRPDDRAKFLKEARAVARLDHENVLALHDVDEDGATLYQVMPLLRVRRWPRGSRRARSGPVK